MPIDIHIKAQEYEFFKNNHIGIPQHFQLENPSYYTSAEINKLANIFLVQKYYQAIVEDSDLEVEDAEAVAFDCAVVAISDFFRHYCKLERAII